MNDSIKVLIQQKRIGKLYGEILFGLLYHCDIHYSKICKGRDESSIRTLRIDFQRTSVPNKYKFAFFIGTGNTINSERKPFYVSVLLPVYRNFCSIVFCNKKFFHIFEFYNIGQRDKSGKSVHCQIFVIVWLKFTFCDIEWTIDCPKLKFKYLQVIIYINQLKQIKLNIIGLSWNHWFFRPEFNTFFVYQKSCSFYFGRKAKQIHIQLLPNFKLVGNLIS